MAKSTAAKGKKETYCKCTHCGDEIYWNTHKKLTFCSCEKTAVDGCEGYIRIIGNKKDWRLIQR